MNVMILDAGCAREVTMEEKLRKELISRGCNLSWKINETDVIVCITCASTGYAFQKCFYDIHSFLDLKNKETKLVIAGCLADQKIFKDLLNREDVKIITNKDFVIPIENYIFDEQKRNSYKTKLENRTRFIRGNNTKIHFFLEEGCINNCSFCKYNYLRREFKSVPFEMALDYLKKLIQNGTKSIILGGESLPLYGIDLYGYPRLHEFIHELSLIDGLMYITLHEITPQNMYPELLKEMTENKKVRGVCLQLETADNRLLGLMNRNYTIEQYASIVQKLAQNGKFITTVLMSGFPTETYQDVEKTIEFVNQNNILVGQICGYSDFFCIPSHNLEQLSDKEFQKHKSLLKKEVGKSNKRIMTEWIPNLPPSIVIGKKNDRTYFDNVRYGYSDKKEFLDCEIGDILYDKPKSLVRSKGNPYLFNYKY